MDEDDNGDFMDVGDNNEESDYEFLLAHAKSWQIESDITIGHINESKNDHEKSEDEEEKKSEKNAVGLPQVKEDISSTGPLLEDKVFRCDVCDKSFSSRSSLNRHQLVHMNKRFKCDVCEKEFTYKCNLDVHKLNHSNIRNFKCEECGKEFTQKCRLTSHKLIHTGVKAFVCDTCQKTFISKSALNRHMLTHSGVKRFKCDACGREFNEKCNLEVHQLTHSGIKPFKCEICGRTFSRKYTLNTHIAVHRKKGELTKGDLSDDSFTYRKNRYRSRGKKLSIDSDRSGYSTANDSDYKESFSFDSDLKTGVENILQLDDDITDLDDSPFHDDHMKNVNAHDPLGLNDFTLNDKSGESSFAIGCSDLTLDCDDRLGNSFHLENGFSMKRMGDEDLDSEFI